MCPSFNYFLKLGEVYYRDQLIRFAAEISDDEDEPSDLVVEWESSLDGVLALSGEADSNGTLEDFGYLSKANTQSLCL